VQGGIGLQRVADRDNGELYGQHLTWRERVQGVLR
jgi:hypothetical protein